MNNKDPKFFLCKCGFNVCNICNWGITGFPPKIKIVEYIVEKQKFTLDNLEECFKYYQTDKYKNNYTEFYKNIFSKFINKQTLNILEIGIARGSSLKVWDILFDKAIIYGIDNNKQCLELCKNYDNIKIIIDNVSYTNGSINKELENVNFDIIIDDGSHLPSDIISSFNLFFDKLNKKGVYIIEDLGPSYNDEYKICNDYSNDISKIGKKLYLEKNSRMKINEFIIKKINDLDNNNLDINNLDINNLDNNNLNSIIINKHIMAIFK
jgi:hypothetical protein